MGVLVARSSSSGLVSGLVLVFVLSAPSAADVATVPDPRGDLMHQDELSGEYVADPGVSEFDIVRTRFRHRLHRVRVRMQFASLEPGFFASYSLRIRTNHGAIASVEVKTFEGSTAIKSSTEFRGRYKQCPVHKTLDYNEDVVVIGLSRRCLESPRWVRVGAFARGGRKATDDDALRDGVVTQQLGHPTLSRDLLRGTW